MIHSRSNLVLFPLMKDLKDRPLGQVRTEIRLLSVSKLGAEP